MSTGLQLFNQSGALTFDSTRYGGVFVDYRVVTQGTSGSVSFPLFNGRTMFLMIVYAGLTNVASGWNNATITAPGGVPTFNWNYPAASGGNDLHYLLYVK